MDLETLKTFLGFGGIGIAGLAIYLGYKERQALNTTLNNHFSHLELATKEEAQAKTLLAVALDRNTTAINKVLAKVLGTLQNR